MFTLHDFQGADGQTLRYGRLVNPEQPDTGQALWFVPGLGGSIKGALDFLDALLPFYSPIYGADLRSFGLNQPGHAPLQNTQSVLADLDAFYQQVIAPKRHTVLSLCGISLGGVLATRLVRQTPERYRRLMLIAPAYRPHPRSFGLGYTVRNTAKFLLQGHRARTVLPYDIRALTQNPKILNDPAYTDTPPLELSPGFLLSVRFLAMKAFNDTRRLHLPTMMIIPGQDVVCDPAAMRAAFARLPQTTPKHCREYPDFYHDVLFETGHAAIAQDVLDWSACTDSVASSSASK